MMTPFCRAGAQYSSRFTTIGLTSIGLAGIGLGCCTLAAAQPGGWQVQAEQALRQALNARHPAVTAWHITALVASRQQQRLAERTVRSAEVARVGKRSAVRLWCEDAPSRDSPWEGSVPRPCATVWFAVGGVQAVLTSARELPPFHPVAAADFVIKPQDVMNLRCLPLASSERVAGLRTTRALGAGAAVCGDYFEPRPAVSRGEPVAVRVVAGAVAITTRAVAQQDAALGQSVRIKRADSAASILATVTGAGQVAIGDSNE